MAKSGLRHYPISLALAGQECVVVGVGAVAERKIDALLKSGARVLAIGREASARIKHWVEQGDISWFDRDFRRGDLEGAFLVIAATDDRQVNELVHAQAVAGQALINVVDAPELCNFFVPAVVERGRLQVAVSTTGASPALAAELRRRFEEELGPEYADYVEVVSDFRRRVRAETADAAKRRQAYERLFASDLLEEIKRGRKIDIDELVGKYAG